MKFLVAFTSQPFRRTDWALRSSHKRPPPASPYSPNRKVKLIKATVRIYIHLYSLVR